MTTRELLLRVLNQQDMERIPVSPFIHVNYVKEFFNDHDVDWVTKTPDVYRHFGFDIMHRNCTPAYDFLGPQGPDWELESITEKDGRDETTTTLIHTPDGDLRCVEKTRWIYEYDAEVSVVEYPVKTEHDLELFMRYQPPPGIADTNDIPKALQAVGQEGVVAPWIQGAFNLTAFYYRKLDDLLLDAMLNTAFYARTMDYFLTRYMVFIQQMIAAGPDVISYGGNIANSKIIGPDFYKNYIASFEKRLIDFIQGQEVIVLYHNCGYASKLLPLYPELGMKAYESLTPPPHGDTFLDQALDSFGKDTTLLGNIDQIDLLRTGDWQEIEAEVKRVLETVRGRAHFILATTDYFNDNTPHENIHALAEAGHKYGGGSR
jgi:hypothetical protein